MAKKQIGEITAKKSAWSNFSIWWGVLVFGLIIPLFLILFYLEDYCVYAEGLPKYIENLGWDSVKTVEEYKKAAQNNTLGANVYQGGLFGLANTLFIQMDVSWADLEKIAEICLGVGIVCFILALYNILYKIVCAKKTSYEINGSLVIFKKGRLFASAEEIRRFVFFPGMSVYVKQGFKGKLFGYGDVVISMGLGEAGEVVMTGVKRPRRLKKKIARVIKSNCIINPYMNMAYAMPPHIYTMNYPQNNG